MPSNPIPEPWKSFLSEIDALRNLFYAPTVEMKIILEFLRQDRYALY